MQGWGLGIGLRISVHMPVWRGKGVGKRTFAVC